MRIARRHIDMLYRVALAELFTSPTRRAEYDVHAALAWLDGKQLVRHDGGRFVITPAGRALLDLKLAKDDLAILRRCEERRAQRTEGAKP